MKKAIVRKIRKESRNWPDFSIGTLSSVSFHVSRASRRKSLGVQPCFNTFLGDEDFFLGTSACSRPRGEGVQMRLHGCYIFSRCLLVHVSRFLEVKTSSRKLIYEVILTRCFLLLVCDREVS